MKRAWCEVLAIAVVAFLALPAAAGAKKSKTAPAPLNKTTKFEAYPDTDIALVTYATSRKEFRVGHAPYEVVRFHVAEFVLFAEHATKYVRPDFKSEIQLVPARAKPELMADKNFQGRWKALLDSYRKLRGEVAAFKIPPECKSAHERLLGAMDDELKLAQAIAKRMFVGQDIRSRELLRADLKKRFRSRDTNWFDRLCDEFEADGDLSKFFPRFADLLIQPQFDKVRESVDQAMGKVGLEYATAVEEDGDIVNP